MTNEELKLKDPLNVDEVAKCLISPCGSKQPGLEE
jgi:hypothetical protein